MNETQKPVGSNIRLPWNSNEIAAQLLVLHKSIPPKQEKK